MARPLSVDARRKMIEAAEVLVLERGVDGFTVDEVARRSGVAKTTIYRHFGSGADLALSAIDAMVEHVDAPDTGSFRSDLHAVIDGFLAITRRADIRQLFISVLSRSMHDEEFAERYRAIKEQRHLAVRKVVQRAIVRGEIDPEIDIELATLLVQGPFVAKQLVDDEQVSDREVDALIELIARALAPAR